MIFELKTFLSLKDFIEQKVYFNWSFKKQIYKAILEGDCENRIGLFV